MTNPFCGYCGDPFAMYRKLLGRYPEDVRIRFVFNTPDDRENPSTKIVLRLLEIYKKDKDQALEALKYWFETKNVDAWFKIYNEPSSMLLTHAHVLENHRDWCIVNEINYTPETNHR